MSKKILALGIALTVTFLTVRVFVKNYLLELSNSTVPGVHVTMYPSAEEINLLTLKVIFGSAFLVGFVYVLWRAIGMLLRVRRS